MKHLIYIPVILLLVACSQGNNSDQEEVTTDMVTKQTSIEFEDELFDFGQISQGEKVEHTFMFENTGDNPLLITSAKGSCGCTIPEWPKDPIGPGEKGKIDVVFSSNGKKGKQHVTVTVVANTIPNTSIVALKGTVLVPENN